MVKQHEVDPHHMKETHVPVKLWFCSYYKANRLNWGVLFIVPSGTVRVRAPARTGDHGFWGFTSGLLAFPDRF